MPKTLLILGTRSDWHVATIADKFTAAFPAIEVVVADFKSCSITFNQAECGTWSLKLDGSDVNGPLLVWDRFKLIPSSELYIDGIEPWAGYAGYQWRAFYSLITSMAGQRDLCKVINSPASRACLIKPVQQYVASLVGFKVPNTIVTNSKVHLEGFVNSSPGVLKDLAEMPFITSDGTQARQLRVQTTAINRHDVSKAEPAEIAIYPHFAQTQLDKRYEVRTIIAGESSISFKINSQAHDSTKLDWRKYENLLEIGPYDLPPWASETIRKFMEKMGLSHGSIDLVVDTNGDYWFLECNQDGQWGNFDQRSGGRVSDLLCEHFYQELNSI